jgi:hypothetical protein
MNGHFQAKIQTVSIRLPREMLLLLFHWGAVRTSGPRVKETEKIPLCLLCEPCERQQFLLTSQDHIVLFQQCDQNDGQRNRYGWVHG